MRRLGSGISPVLSWARKSETRTQSALPTVPNVCSSLFCTISVTKAFFTVHRHPILAHSKYLAPNDLVDSNEGPSIHPGIAGLRDSLWEFLVQDFEISKIAVMFDISHIVPCANFYRFQITYLLDLAAIY